jgi:WD40 repeat protein
VFSVYAYLGSESKCTIKVWDTVTYEWIASLQAHNSSTNMLISGSDYPSFINTCIYKMANAHESYDFHVNDGNSLYSAYKTVKMLGSDSFVDLM